MITIKTEKEIALMEEGGKILAKVLKRLGEEIKPGITTEHLNRVAEDLVFELGGKPSFKGYEGFPASLCVCINEEIVHCPPSKRKLKEGDIVSADFGVLYKGYHTDAARTFPVGEVSPETQRLIRVTKKSLKRALRKIKPGNTIGDIGNSVQRYVEDQGFNVVRELTGHGIGKEIHEDPQILNYGKRHTGEKIEKGMVLCVEPMVTVGDWKIKRMDNGAFKTKDNSLSCHFEDTILVTERGCRVLTEL